MMKTQIVICCDKCENILSDQTECYGYFKTNLSSVDEYYFCKKCIDSLIINIQQAITKFINNNKSNHEEVYFDFGERKKIKVLDLYVASNIDTDSKSYIIQTRNSIKTGYVKYSAVIDQRFVDGCIFGYPRGSNTFYDVVSEKIKEFAAEAVNHVFYHDTLEFLREHAKRLKDYSLNTCRCSDNTESSKSAAIEYI